MKCRECGTELEQDVKFCTKCGANVIDEPKKQFCTKCGNEIPEAYEFCVFCGTPVSGTSALGRDEYLTSQLNSNSVDDEKNISVVSENIKQESHEESLEAPVQYEATKTSGKGGMFAAGILSGLVLLCLVVIIAAIYVIPHMSNGDKYSWEDGKIDSKLEISSNEHNTKESSSNIETTASTVDITITESTTEEETSTEKETESALAQNPDYYNQKIEVVVSEGSSYGKMTLYQWNKKDGGWKKVKNCSDWDCTVGKDGISKDFGEGKWVSPKGTWDIGVALVDSGVYTGKYEDVYGVTYSTGIIDDVNSSFYNCIVEDNRAHKDPSGQTILSGICNALIMIECNGDGRSNEGVVAGKGSAITICGVNHELTPTYGCIDITSANMVKLLDALSVESNPVIIVKKK